MDLIYTDAAKVDQGVLQHYTLDFDAAGTKDFEMTVDADMNVVDLNSIWYVDSTELFGVVEYIKSDADAGTVTYSGRNARGLLNSKIVMPRGYVAGKFSDILWELLSESGLTDRFVPNTDLDVDIPEFRFSNYCTLYDGLTAMLDEFDCKLVLTCWSGVVYVGAEIKRDYSDYLQYGTDNALRFVIENNQMGVNHLVCLGAAKAVGRYVIHLFTDENGGIQPYATKYTPQQDSDYILDESQKLIFGTDEYAKVYDDPNADVVTNYILLTSIPADWYSNYASYYRSTDSEKFDPVQGLTETVYELLTAKPLNWETTFGGFFEKNTDGEYVSVQGVDVTKYEKLKNKPADWTKNYASYYEYWSDGVTSSYNSVSGVAYDKYLVQTQKPTDWHANFNNYYKKKTVNGKEKYVTVDTDLPYHVTTKEKNVKIYEKASASSKAIRTVKEKGKVFNISKEKDNFGYIASLKGWIQLSKVDKSKPKAPDWQKNKYYTKETRYKAPDFDGKTYYKQVVLTDQPPGWTANKYYSREDKTYAPPFTPFFYFQQVLDHYSELVAGGIQYLKENGNSMGATMIIDGLDCQIGDIVGGVDYESGVELFDKVTNIIITATDGDMNFEYQIGDEKNGL